MYALYSKNKPQSDTLLSSHGNEFFKVRSGDSHNVSNTKCFKSENTSTQLSPHTKDYICLWW